MAVISSLSDKEAEALLFDWESWARPEQLLPAGDWPIWLIKTGRGWGKTRTGAESVVQWAKDFSPIALVGQTKADARDTMIELGESSILKISPPWFKPEYEPSKRRLVWPNGAIGVVYSGDEPDQLRGPQHMKAWVDELAKFKYPDESWDNLEMGLRIGKSPQAIITTTPRPIKIIKQLMKDPAIRITSGNTNENRANLSRRFVERIFEKYGGTRLGRQELAGEILDDRPGALWTLKLIDEYRVSQAPQLIRVVVAVDPEAESTEDSAETGVIVVGLGANKHAYVVADRSLRATPRQWAASVINGYHDFHADRVVGEVNNGGEMIETVIRSVDPAVSYKAVRASRGKLTRAEPVSALYEQGKVHHVGAFPELEDQMTSWVPGEVSPDRMDALVWAITELMLEEVVPEAEEQVYENGVDEIV